MINIIPEYFLFAVFFTFLVLYLTQPCPNIVIKKTKKFNKVVNDEIVEILSENDFCNIGECIRNH